MGVAMLNLEPIKARLAAVPTPLWGEFCESGDWWIQQKDDEGSPVGAVICNSNPEDMTQEVADFIVAAPADIAALLNEVERLREELTVVRERCSVLTQAHCSCSGCTEQRAERDRLAATEALMNCQDVQEAIDAQPT